MNGQLIMNAIIAEANAKEAKAIATKLYGKICWDRRTPRRCSRM